MSTENARSREDNSHQYTIDRGAVGNFDSPLELSIQASFYVFFLSHIFFYLLYPRDTKVLFQ